MVVNPRNVSVPEGWPLRTNTGGYGPDLDASLRYHRGRHNPSTGRNTMAWYNVNTGYHAGFRIGTDGPFALQGALSPAPYLMGGVHPLLPLLDAQVYALMLGRRISGPWLGDVRAGGVPWESAVDTSRPFGRKAG